MPRQQQADAAGLGQVAQLTEGPQVVTEVPVVGTDLLTSASHNGKVTVDAGSVAVVREGT